MSIFIILRILWYVLNSSPYLLLTQKHILRGSQGSTHRTANIWLFIFCHLQSWRYQRSQTLHLPADLLVGVIVIRQPPHLPQDAAFILHGLRYLFALCKQGSRVNFQLSDASSCWAKVLFCAGNLCALWVRPCRSWRRPDSWPCRCRRPNGRGRRWGWLVSTRGRRTQRCRGCSQTAARRPVGITPTDRQVQGVQLVVTVL